MKKTQKVQVCLYSYRMWVVMVEGRMLYSRNRADATLFDEGATPSFADLPFNSDPWFCTEDFDPFEKVSEGGAA